MVTAMRPLILLFDIDGTLISTSGAGRRAIERAFGHRHGRADACASVSFGGMTDRAILRAGLTALGVPVEPAAIDALIAAYLPALHDEITRAECRIHDGIERALDAARANARCAVGLGTGNIREGARVKLSKVGIYERFAFGGFGCDHEDRGELLRIGAERGAAALGVARAACRVVVIGDTPKDVAAARAIGATSVAVATGSFSPAELTAAGATHVFRDLTDPAALPTLLGA
jgi:phosphoglycolate phosphatase